jgi:hypothetical protein
VLEPELGLLAPACLIMGASLEMLPRKVFHFGYVGLGGS